MARAKKCIKCQISKLATFKETFKNFALTPENRDTYF